MGILLQLSLILMSLCVIRYQDFPRCVAVFVCVCVCVCVYYACMCAYTISTFVCGYVWCVCVCMCAYESYGMPFYLSFPDLKTLLPIITMVIVTNEQ